MNIELIHGNKNNTRYFASSDNLAKFRRNLRDQPPEWYWRKHPVRYTLNSQQYRCNEWDQINWSESILVFGCSFVFGEGVDDNQTLPYYLSEILDVPCINLGQPGGSITMNWANSTRICDYGITPKAVIYLWPAYHRLSEFRDRVSIINRGPWTTREDSILATEWMAHDEQSKQFSYYCTRSSRLLWQCPVLEYSWDVETVTALGLRSLTMGSPVSYARDMSHPGPDFHSQAAATIAKDYHDSL